jgi:hypothetical protein
MYGRWPTVVALPIDATNATLPAVPGTDIGQHAAQDRGHQTKGEHDDRDTWAWHMAETGDGHGRVDLRGRTGCGDPLVGATIGNEAAANPGLANDVSSGREEPSR